MKIGVDLDGVIFDSENLYRVYAELYDMLELNRNSLLENREVRIQERFNWSQEEIDKFFDKYQKEILTDAPFMPGAIKVLKMLKAEGHELIVITARGGSDIKSIDLTMQILEDNDMNIFDKYYWITENKDEICVQEKVDLMIDDSNIKCKAISEKGIKTIYFKDAPNFEMEENEYLKTLYNWGEVYRYIKEAENAN